MSRLVPIVLAALLVMLPTAHDARAQSIVVGDGTNRALIIGIDDYIYVQHLRGASADARDLENTLRNLGVTDLSVLLNATATRGSVLLAFQQIIDRTQPGDTIFLALSGHGAQEPERVKGSEPDGMDTVFLLAGFDPTSRERNGEKILDKEFNHFIRQIEERGGKVLFIADTCSGGGLAREVDPRSEEMSYRAVKYTPIQDDIHPVVDRIDAMSTPADFKTSIFLAAVDKQSKVPEIRVPGIGFRGALSYAVSRGLEGAADLDGNGTITAAELFEYSRRVAYQLSDQRQSIVTISGRDTDPKTLVVAEADRGIAVTVGTGTAPAKTEEVKPTVPTPAPPQPQVKTQQPKPIAPSAPPAAQSNIAKKLPQQKPQPAPAIRVAALDGQASHFSGMSTQIPYQVVSPTENPDLVWDTTSGEVVANGDVIARNVESGALPGLIERTVAINWLKSRVAQSPQAIRVMPNDRVHRSGSHVGIEIDNLSGRSLILFNIAGDGTVQLLYPIGSDPVLRREAIYSLQVEVRPPFGADQIVAVSSTRQLSELIDAMKKLNGRRNPIQISDLLGRYAGQDALVGSAAMYTSP